MQNPKLEPDELFDLFTNLCKAFNLLLPAIDEKITPIPEELTTRQKIDVEQFAPRPITPIGKNETFLDIMSPFEKNVYAASYLIRQNLILLEGIYNDMLKKTHQNKKISNIIRAAKYCELFETLKHMLNLSEFILSENIDQRFMQKDIPISGDILVRKDYSLVQAHYQQEEDRKKFFASLILVRNEDGTQEEIHPGFYFDHIPTQ